MTQQMHMKEQLQIVGSIHYYMTYYYYSSQTQYLIIPFHTFPLMTVGREKRPIKSLVVGRPILLALEDIDGSPSFLEKALYFIEKHGRAKESLLVPMLGTVCILHLVWPTNLYI